MINTSETSVLQSRSNGDALPRPARTSGKLLLNHNEHGLLGSKPIAGEDERRNRDSISNLFVWRGIRNFISIGVPENGDSMLSQFVSLTLSHFLEIISFLSNEMK